jgi:hypothetical protein
LSEQKIVDEMRGIDHEMRELSSEGALFGYISELMCRIASLEEKLDATRIFHELDDLSEDDIAKACANERILTLLIRVEQRRMAATEERQQRIATLTLRKCELEKQLGEMREGRMTQKQLRPLPDDLLSCRL